jgi:hypothetical protein
VIVVVAVVAAAAATCFTLVSSLAYSWILKMEAICFSETSVNFQQTTRRYIPEARTLNGERCFSRPIIAYRHGLGGLATGCIKQ